MHSPVDVPLDIDWPAGKPQVRVGRIERLHERRLQRQASCVCIVPRHGIDMGLYELRPLHELG